MAISVPINSTSRLVSLGGISLAAHRLWLPLRFANQLGNTVTEDCLLDTGAPMSVIPFSVYDVEKFSWQRISASATTWYGVRCDVGTMDIWLFDNAGVSRGPFPLLAKFPLSDPTALTRRGVQLPILVGIQFLTTIQAELRLQCLSRALSGTLSVP